MPIPQYTTAYADDAAFEYWIEFHNINTPSGANMEFRWAFRGREFRPETSNLSETLSSTFDLQYSPGGGFGGNGHRVWLFYYSAINGGLGNDTITGLDNASFSNVRDDILARAAVLGATADLAGVELYANASDLLMGDAGNDTLYGMGGNDVLLGGADQDYLGGSDGNDYLDGGTGNDVLQGGAGADNMTGGLGNDIFYVDNLGDVVVELSIYGDSSQGTQDTIISSVNVRFDQMPSAEGIEHITINGNGNVTLVGTGTFNTLAGNIGNNYLSGLGGNDSINGAGGNDRVFGGAGKDLLTGGTGDDAFLYSFVADSGGTQPRRDVISDFSQISGNNDWIDLALADANGVLGGNQAFVWRGTAGFTGAAGELRYYQDAANGRTIIEGNTRVDAASPGAEFSIELTGLKTLTAGTNLTFDIIV